MTWTEIMKMSQRDINRKLKEVEKEMEDSKRGENKNDES